MSSANVDAMVREAKRAIREGNKSEAQALLLRATEIDQSNEQAWMWLSAVVESIEDQMICLENVLQINPKNADAKRGLDMLRKKAPPPIEKPPSKPNNPFLVEGSEWDIDGNTDFLLDALSPTPSKSNKPSTSSSTSPRDLISDDDDPINPPTDPFVSVFESADVFQTAYDDVDDEPESDSLDRLGALTDKKPATQPKPPTQSKPPTSYKPVETKPTSTFDDNDILSLDDDIFGGGAVDEVDEFLSDDSFLDAPPPTPKSQKASSQPPKQKAPSKPAKEPEMAIGTDEDPGVYFEMIPADIKPTRVPGIDETYPPMMIPSLLGLVVLNIGALVLFLL
ncbi:MAG: hypothetical protein SFZ02_22090 [bacterium]|nr:hypothetical protein [bacterium]